MSLAVPVLPTTKASDLYGSYRNAVALAEEGCRAQLINKLTACPMPAIRSFIEMAGGNHQDKGGRLPRSISSLLEDVKLHTAASYFLKVYINNLGHYGGGRGVPHADSFVRALKTLRSNLRDSGGRPLEFTPDHAILVTTLYHESEASLKRCSHCTTVFLVANKPQLIRAHTTSGECPMCRTLAGVYRGRSVVRVTDARQQRKILDMFASSRA
ncbi:hypothetical protein [Stenotrophomonas maltophilia]|uniref:hypothetical protein n=1 Tax=Stenotrophomonas maltophilia TaxID=40324 RepID=UPI0021C8296B|nr:hypothetical protein [Stenotrophomonas maltophilia]MCU1137022.1 hypothetical protein [Stenotrophomonas maltophilia]